ncbi:phosphonate metabolism protein/1,5-bisphosphokinase (PRPP-forming) PhnN [Pelagibaculum spongiae]|uniref:ribose 1,5-bisphosphate phosphokinase n=1 Tax=Pelagibaculum spongiae TaxID=2080658 RepID=A0A2V1GZT7_9GAMM|nr:phosphonate metabolism protein/1,5-bisphosphokinase (PRPP-forming) PhnN [Pelagibaculum spongiae]PVZ67649.1 phosphonate metabolism protein/1,5-bisphosphokinase (PRPP-forming) PhnN [Pelagibaculum spongiae]
MHGELFYLMGASGSGKESLISYLRLSLGESQLSFPKRMITREAKDQENHQFVSVEQFEVMKTAGELALSWNSHGYWYGFAKEIHQLLADGKHVMINGSREYLSEVAKIFPNIWPILLDVHPDILRQRLEQRGKDDELAIEDRIHTSKMPVNHPRLKLIDNNHSIGQASQELVRYINQVLEIPAE